MSGISGIFGINSLKNTKSNVNDVNSLKNTRPKGENGFLKDKGNVNDFRMEIPNDHVNNI